MIAFASPSPSSPDPRQRLPLANFLAETLADISPATAKNAGIAVVHFGRFLHRAALVSDLTTDSIEQLAAWLVSCGKRPGTANRTAQELVRMGTLASARGLVHVAPFYSSWSRDYRRRAPFTASELERLLAAALHEPGAVAGLPAKDWWPAFILAGLNTQLPAVALVRLPATAFDAAAGTLRAEGLVYALHPHTADALTQLAGATANEALFPWESKASRPVEMLLYYFARLLRRASVPSQRYSAFDRLRVTIEQLGSSVLDRLDPSRIERERQAIEDRRQAADCRQAEQDRARRRGNTKRPSRKSDGGSGARATSTPSPTAARVRCGLSSATCTLRYGWPRVRPIPLFSMSAA